MASEHGLARVSVTEVVVTMPLVCFGSTEESSAWMAARRVFSSFETFHPLLGSSLWCAMSRGSWRSPDTR